MRPIGAEITVVSGCESAPRFNLTLLIMEAEAGDLNQSMVVI